MAIIRCPRHGLQGCAKVSKKALDFIKKFKYSNDIVPLAILSEDKEDLYYDPYVEECKNEESDVPYTGNIFYWILREELGKYPFIGRRNKQGNVMIFASGDETIDDATTIAGGPICCLCFKEYRAHEIDRYGWSNET